MLELGGVIDGGAIGERCRVLAERRVLDGRGWRLWAAAGARSHGHGGIAAVVRATGFSEFTVLRGLAELGDEQTVELGRVRRPGGGQKPVSETNPGIEAELGRLVDPVTRGGPESPLRWTSKSAPKLAGALAERGLSVSESTVLRLLRRLGYSLQANQEPREGARYPDRDAQFEQINRTVAAALAAGEPAISIDSKKRELVGDFKAVGREFEPTGRPVAVRSHDFRDKDLGHAIPFGVLDLSSDEGWVNVGIDPNTAEFAVNSILSWWEHLGRERYPHAKTLTITADCGGANSNRTKLWKVQ